VEGGERDDWMVQNNVMRKKPYSMQWKIMLAVTLVTAAGSMAYVDTSGTSSFYIDYLFVWPAIAAVYSGLIYLLPELRSRTSNIFVFSGVMLIMAGSVWRGVIETDTVSSQVVIYIFGAGMMLFLVGIVVSLLCGAWKLRC
jgi:hypothetical protein